MDSDQELIERLSQLSLQEKLEVIAKDVATGCDEFHDLDPFLLASLLEVPEAERPGAAEHPLWGQWIFTKYVQRVPLSEYVEWHFPAEEVIYLLEGQVDEARYIHLVCQAELIHAGEQEFSLSLFSDEEKRLIENAIMEKEYDEPCGGTVIANCRIGVPGNGGALSFEALIEDDGECITLLTPYDARDGHFADLTDCIAGW